MEPDYLKEYINELKVQIANLKEKNDSLQEENHKLWMSHGFFQGSVNSALSLMQDSAENENYITNGSIESVKKLNACGLKIMDEIIALVSKQ